MTVDCADAIPDAADAANTARAMMVFFVETPKNKTKVIEFDGFYSLPLI